MTSRPSKQDKESSKGMLLAVIGVVMAMAVAAVAHFLWRSQADKTKIKIPAALYLSLGEQAIGIGNHSVLIHFSIEFVGRDTEEALKKALPSLKNQVLNRMAQITTSDLDRLRTPQGKRELAEDMRELVKYKLPDEDAENVKDVLYEKFLIGD